MTLTRTEDKTDKAITRLLLQNPMGLTIGDITAEAKCTPQTARKSLARIGAEKDASGMLYVLRDDDDEQSAQAEPEAATVPEQTAHKPSEVLTENWGGIPFLNPFADAHAPEPTDPEPTDPAPAQKPLRRGDLVMWNGEIHMLFDDHPDSHGEYRAVKLTGEYGYDYTPAKELTRIGSIRKKVKRIKKEMEGGK